MAKKHKRKRPPGPFQKAKKLTNDWCSRYVRIKAAIEFNPNQASDLVGRCYTCRKIVNVIYNHAGHFKSRGSGGSSGLYFNVKSIRLQCVDCNAFNQGCPTEFREHLVEEYDEAQVQKLEILHKIYSYSIKEIVGLGLYFKSEVEQMCAKHGIRPWW